jgi:hypothetical protein
MSTAAKVGAVAVGGAFIVGAAIFAFGDVGATAAGLSSIVSAGFVPIFSLVDTFCMLFILNCIHLRLNNSTLAIKIFSVLLFYILILIVIIIYSLFLKSYWRIYAS